MKDEANNRAAAAFGWLWLVFCGGLIAASAAGWMHARQHHAGAVLVGMVGEGFLAWGVLSAAGRWERRFSSRRWPLFLLGGGVILKLPALWLMNTYAQVMDRGYFVSFVNRLAGDGLSAVGIGNLAHSVYDFYSFFPRSFALALPIRLLVGEEAMVPVHQWVCWALAVLSTWMVYELLRSVFSDRTARLASGLHLVFPLRNITFLDFAHQVPGEFTLLLGLLSIFGAMRFARAGMKAAAAAGIFLSLCLGHLLVGVDVLIVSIGLGLLAFGWRSFSAQSRRRDAGLVLCAILLAGGLLQAFSAWQNRLAPAPLSSGQAAFMARGWSIRGWGEYDGWLEVVDREAPPVVKSALMRAYVGSQIRFHPVRTFARLLPVKAIKYFLPGFASGSEQALEAGGHVASAGVLAGARLIYAVFLLAAVVLGCLRSGSETESKGRFVCLLILGVSCVAQILGGETSPRYAYFLHFLLLAVAAGGLDAQRKVAGGLRWIGSGLAHGIIYGMLAVALAIGFRASGEERFLRDLRTVRIESPAREWTPDAVDQNFFWRTAAGDPEGSPIRLFVPDVPEPHRQLHLFFSAVPAAGWQFSCDGEPWRELRAAQSALIDISGPAHRTDGGVDVSVRFRRAIPGEGPAAQIGIGYLLTGNFDQEG